MRFFRRIREYIKLGIWDYVDTVQTVLRSMGACVSLFTMCVIVYYYGFEQTAFSAQFCNVVVRCSLVFYVVKYFCMCFFNKHALDYIRRNWGEGLVILLLLIWIVLRKTIHIHFLDVLLGSDLNMNSGLMLLLQCYFFLLMLMEMSSLGQILGKLHLGPSGMMMSSFLILISVGTVLLLLPEMTTHGISFVDALFMATSASCITGLSTLNVAADLTFKGQVVLLLLIQLGGMNIICFATFFMSFYKGGNLRYQSIIKEMLNTNMQNSRSLTREIMLYTFLIELIGFIFLFVYVSATEVYSSNTFKNMFFSLFHTISAFNNAGFSILENGMQNGILVHNYYIQTLTIIMVFLGGIGFITIHDLVNAPKGKGRRHYWNRLQIATRVVMRMSIVLLFLGAIMFLLLEHNHIKTYSVADQIYAALFTSMSCRSSGFSTVDISFLNTSTIVVMMVLMIIGTSSGSTGGGIKLSTFYVLLKSVWSTITNRRQVTIGNRAVSFDIVNKSYVVLQVTIILILMGILSLSISDPQFPFMKIVYEVISACGTVGSSMGITPYLSSAGKFTLIVLMYIGRITVLTLAISITRKAFNKYTLAGTNINI